MFCPPQAANLPTGLISKEREEEKHWSRARRADLKEKACLVHVWSNPAAYLLCFGLKPKLFFFYPTSLKSKLLFFFTHVFYLNTVFYPWCSAIAFCCRVPRRISVEERTRQRAILKPKICIIGAGRCAEVLQQKRREYLGSLCAGEGSQL